MRALLVAVGCLFASSAAFKDQDTLDLFVREWTKYWKEL